MTDEIEDGSSNTDGSEDAPPWKKNQGWEKKSRAAIQAAAGAVPFVGGILAAAASYWSESDQEKINNFLQAWLKMLEDEFREKEQTISEIVARLDIQEERIGERIRSDEYQSLLKKAFRNWAGAESKIKRDYVRNILANAASTDLTSDDVVSLFLEWLQNYSEFHFAVIAEIYRNERPTRASIWSSLGKGNPREDSAEADLYKLLFRDLSTGGVIRQHRETDYQGNFIAKKSRPSTKRGTNDRQMTSAFDDREQYELTALGQQFVHYAMSEIPTKIEYNPQQ